MAKRMSQDDLAELLCTSRQWISDIERERCSPTLRTCERIARAFKMTPKELFNHIYSN